RAAGTCQGLLEQFDEAKVAELDTAAEQHHVVGLHVAVLDALGVEIVQSPGGGAHMSQQLRQRDAGQVFLLDGLPKMVEQRAVSQFHRQNEEVAALPSAVQSQQVGVAQVLDQLQRA